MTQWGLDALFNPAKRHMDEEKRRLQSTREEIGDSSGGKRIDLESGRVVIRRPDEDAEDADDAGADSDGPGGADTGPDSGPEAKDAGSGKKASDAKPKREPSAAAIRAAARRGRQPR